MKNKMRLNVNPYNLKSVIQKSYRPLEIFSARKKISLNITNEHLTLKENGTLGKCVETAETPEEKKLRQMAAFNNFVNSTTDAEEPEATAEFFRIMDAEEARKAAFS